MDNDKLLDHEYDGIQELDNNLPLWWLWTFFGAIIFSFIYWIHYSFLQEGPSLDQELSQSMAQIEQMRNKEVAAADGENEPTQEELIAAAAPLYKVNCASCHMDNGAGSIGPNLTDSYWIHGNSEEAIAKVLKKGVLDKGMPPWENILRPQQIKAMVAFVKSLEGKNVEGGKAPQGEKVE